MKILDINVMRGPNIWSIRRHKLIVMRLDLEGMEDFPTNKVEGFPERLEKMFPTLYSHRCSENYEGGFFHRVHEGTWMGHVVEHVALELQTLAGMDVGFGRTRETNHKGIYNVVFAYMEERVGVYTAKTAVKVVDALIKNVKYDLTLDIKTMREIREEERLGPSTYSIVEEAIRRDIPHMRLNRFSLVQLGYGCNQQRIQATQTSKTSSIAVEIACSKNETKELLENGNIPVPKGDVVKTEKELKSVIEQLQFPLVIKPVNGNHGKGATINITDYKIARSALRAAQKFSRDVLVEKYITGVDFRALVVNHKFIAAAQRTPAHIIGDGKSSMRDLIKKVNSDPRRGYGHENVLTEIMVDKMTKNILKQKGVTLNTILPENEIFYLKATANLSTGGTSIDVTELVHPSNVFMFERISRIIDLDICGIDIMAPDLSVPIEENGGAILEVNAAPGFRMHLAPASGLPRNVAEPVIDMLYPAGTNARIPIIAITGTNGKTTTTRLIAHIMRTIGHKVGFTTTDGIYIQNRMLVRGDCTGPQSAKFVLTDPGVDYAVLETARGGILRAGLGFSRCDVGIVTNVAEDHLGLKDIDTLDELARVKSVVVESVSKDGYAVLNADDPLVSGMSKGLSCKIAYFSMNERNPIIKKHTEEGSIAAVYENGYITICKGTWKIRIDKVLNIPLTLESKATFMIQNILAATLAGFVQQVKVSDLKLALETFIPSASQTPGRLNIFEFKNFTVLVDFAHNPAGMLAIANFLEKVEAKPKVGIIAAVGDRRDQDIRRIGEIGAKMFDKIFIRQDKDLRGRTTENIVQLVTEGISSVNPELPWESIPKEADAFKKAIETAEPGSFIAFLCDNVPEALSIVQKYKEEETKFKITKKDIPSLSAEGAKGN
ncbi:MAG: cyanophycin synthetase [Bacteroidetes bacterium RIFCSPLOWO2_12_FULL_37_12]|nr:MAG: cyanophycin synthetase [Bacteroidetes bacterium RIFCSPLOWO2_12_FULL_37_12]